MLAYKHAQLLRSGFELGKGDKFFQDNDRAILKAIFWHEDVTQVRISELTKIPQQTVSRLVKALMAKDVIRPTDGSTQSSRSPIETNPQYAYTFGLSILINAIAVTLMDFRGDVIDSRLYEMEDMNIGNVLGEAKQLARQLIETHQVPEQRILGIGVGISGFFCTPDGKMNTHAALAAWAEVNIAKVVAEAFNLPAWVVNDGTGAAAGEGIAGAGRRLKNFVYLFISTAFGGGLITNGDILKGTFGNAGELGDMLPPKLYCHPNLEVLRRILLKNGVEIPSIYRLKDEFDPNWPGIDEWIYKVIDSLDLVTTCSSALLDTQAIILGGHIPTALSEKVIPKISVYGQYRRGEKRPQPNILTASVVDNPVAAGAASLPLREWCF